MKIIVKKNDGGVIIIHPNQEKFGDGLKPYSECKTLKKYIDDGFEWFVTDQAIDKSDLESRTQLYWDGDEVKKDLLWEKRLMPSFLVKKKHIKSVNEKIDSELAKDESDVISALKLQREKEKCENEKCELFWAEKALEGLDRAEVDKPVIRQKLEEKITKLKG